MLKRFLVVFILILSLSFQVKAETVFALDTLVCSFSKETDYGSRKLKVTVIPPKDFSYDNDRSLFALGTCCTEEELIENPVAIKASGIGIGRVEVKYGYSTESDISDLYFLKVGTKDGSSHVAFWFSKGAMQHANFIIVDVWENNISAKLMESVEPEPYITGSCG